MLVKKQTQYLRSLRLKKYRQQHRQYVVEGDKIVSEVLAAFPKELQMVVCTAEYHASIRADIASRLGSRLICASQQTLSQISSLDTPSPVLALLDIPAARPHQPIKGLGLYLDGIQDPGNLGTILRIADWFSISSVILSEGCVDVYNPKVIQASAGAFLRVQASCQGLEAVRAAQPNLAVLGTTIRGGENALQYAWPNDVLLVIGSEGCGIRSEYQASISKWLSIPRGNSAAGAESLNAAVATGILCAAYFARTQATTKLPGTN